MSAAMRNGLVVAALHAAIVGSLGGKLLIDRATRPRVWARAAPVDPDLPIRGRYVSLRLEVHQDPALDATTVETRGVALAARDGRLVAVSPPDAHGLHARPTVRAGERLLVLGPPVAYFIPEHAADPSRLASGEELWVEVTIPRAGAPRPIRLGVKKDGVLTPLDLD